MSLDRFHAVFKAHGKVVYGEYHRQDGLTMSDGELAWTNVDKPLRCVTVNRANLGKTVHPTQKPLKVVEFCLDYAGEGEVVLDLFCNSGSTLIACEQLNRRCFMWSYVKI